MKALSFAQTEPAIFGAHAAALRRAGLAVMPAHGKKPIRSGFQNWRQAPGVAIIEKWAEKNPQANIAYVPGLSRTRKNPNGLVVVDADNAAEIQRVEKLFGRTPAIIDTRRGQHFIYRASEASLGNIGSLRRAGFDIDIKHGQKGSGISVAPPSRHPNQPDFTYKWHSGSGVEALTELPTFDVKALNDLLARQSETLRNATRPSGSLSNATRAAPAPGEYAHVSSLGRARPELFRDGSRKLGLNDHLCAHASFIEDLEACLDVARSWNDDLQDRLGLEKLPEPEVLEVCHSVMDGIANGRLVRTLRRRATAITDANEIRKLASAYQNGDAALTLLMLFRAEHAARCRRGETFAICIEAMVEAGTLGEWAARRYRDARNVLLHEGLIELVSEARGPGLPAQYRLTDRVLTPCISLDEGS